jgi:hypothetical protein
MFSYLSKDGKLALRLPAGEREAFLKKYQARLCDAYGRVQVEYVEVPDALLSSESLVCLPVREPRFFSSRGNWRLPRPRRRK